MNSSRTNEAIINGDVDAVAFQNHVNTIHDRLGEAIITLPVQSSQLVYGLLVARTDWLTWSSKTVQRFINALSEAEEYLVPSVITKGEPYDQINDTRFIFVSFSDCIRCTS